MYFQEGIPLCDQRLSLAAFSSPDDEAFCHVCSVKDGKRTAHVQFPLGFFARFVSLMSQLFQRVSLK